VGTDAQAGVTEVEPLDHDIIVVGAGPVGGTLALSLADIGFRVCVIDSKKPSLPDGGDEALDQRTTALSSSSASILDALGLWPELRASACPITEIQVSQQGTFGTCRLRAEESGVTALGYVVNNDTFRHLFSRKINATQNLQLIAPATLADVSPGGRSVTAVTEHQGKISRHRAALIVAVDGSSSTTRKLCQVAATEHDYAQTAIVTSIRTESDHNGVAFERFTPDGPFASLPVEPFVSSIVYTVPGDRVNQVMSLSKPEFIAQLQTVLGRRLGKLIDCGSRGQFPLVLTESAQSHVDRVLFLGNASRTLHPVAGQGFNLAMRDVGKLVELLGKGFSQDTELSFDPGAPALLESFAADRRSDQRRTVWLTDGLAKTFRGNSRWFSHLRAIGLGGLGVVPPLRKRFAQSAMGYGPDLPDLRYRK